MVDFFFCTLQERNFSDFLFVFLCIKRLSLKAKDCLSDEIPSDIFHRVASPSSVSIPLNTRITCMLYIHLTHTHAQSPFGCYRYTGQHVAGGR